MPYKSPVRQTFSGSFLGDTPRKQAPVPMSFEPGERVADISDIEKVPTSRGNQPWVIFSLEAIRSLF